MAGGIPEVMKMNVEHRVPRKRNKGTSTQARHLLASQQPFRDSLAVELLAGVQRAFRVSTLAALRKKGGMATSLRCARGRSSFGHLSSMPTGPGPSTAKAFPGGQKSEQLCPCSFALSCSELTRGSCRCPCRCRAVSLSRVVVMFSAPQAVSGAAGGLRSDFRN